MAPVKWPLNGVRQNSGDGNLVNADQLPDQKQLIKYYAEKLVGVRRFELPAPASRRQ